MITEITATTPSKCYTVKFSFAFIATSTASSFIPRRNFLFPYQASSPIPLPFWSLPNSSSHTSATLDSNTKPYSASLFQTWRSPRWMNHEYQRESQRDLKIQIPDYSPSPPIFSLALRDLPLKLLFAIVLATFLPTLAVTYVRFNTFSRNLVSSLVQSSLDRPVQVGRIARCNPVTGIRLVNVILPPSVKYPTAPVISANRVDITFSGFFRAIAFRTPLSLDVRLSDANIRVSQRVVQGPKGLPIAQWDSGLPQPSSLETTIGLENDIHVPSQPKASTKKLPTSSQMEQILRLIQPGTLTVRNSYVTMQPADFQDYSHGDEPVHFRNASATVTFPTVSLNQSQKLFVSTTSADLVQNRPPISLHGDFNAMVKGTPVEGGTILMACSAKGDTIFDLQPEDPCVHMRITGQGVRADRVASFLNFPFRADSGRCAADIEMDFLYRSKSLVPLMQGSADLEGVSLRFHPDPKTPEFRDISGTLRFVDKVMFVGNGEGVLGSLPMDVTGNIHLEDGYDLKGSVKPVDVNNIIDTFDVEKFVPVQGVVSGDAFLTGSLEEPMVRGTAESVEAENIYPIFDRLPLKSAVVSFDWDAVAGILQYPEIRAEVKGGGIVSGSGSMYFDMTKQNEWDIRQENHNERNPKAEYFSKSLNGDEPSKKPLPGLPSDVMEIDEYAPYREYDSMKFTFRATDVNGGDLLKYFGGEYGEMAKWSLGRVSGEAIMAGHVKDANCRVIWKSISSPPDIPLLTESDESEDEKNFNPSNITSSKSLTTAPNETESVKKSEVSPAKRAGAEEQNRDNSSSTIVKEREDERNVPNQDRTSESKSKRRFNGRLGGGKFNGLVYIKFGDPPEARRVKVRTIVQNFDARRAGWADNKLKERLLKHSPQLRTEMDTFFKGVMFQRAVLPSGVTEIPRTPQMQLLGVDGAVAIRGLKLNDLTFDDVMSGSFSFGTSDFAMALRQVVNKVKTEKEHWELTSFKGFESESDSYGASDVEDSSTRIIRVSNETRDELTLIGSVGGKGRVNIRRGRSEIVGSMVPQGTEEDSDAGHIGYLKTRNVAIEDIFGKHEMSNRVKALGGTLDADLNINTTSRIGDGNLLIRDVSFGSIKMSSVGGDVKWNGDDLFLKNGFIKHRNSEYDLNGRYGVVKTHASSSVTDDFESSLNIGIRHADFKDVSKLIGNGKSLAAALRKANTLVVENGRDGTESGVTVHNLSPEWLQKLVQCIGDNDDEGRSGFIADRWEVPPNLSASQKAEWLMRVAEERKELERMGRLKKSKRKLRRIQQKARRRQRQDQSIPIDGAVSGQLNVSYHSKDVGNSSSGNFDSRWTLNESDSKKGSVQSELKQLLDEFSKATFSFEVTGENCHIGDMPLRNVSASGIYDEGVLTIGPMSFEGEEGPDKFGAEAEVRITHAGGVDGSVIVKSAPASLVQKYSNAPVKVSGSCSGRLEVEGNLSNPRALGRLVWTDASLNGETVRDARGDLACVNGRCLLNVDGRIGGRGKSSNTEIQRLDILNWHQSVSDELKDLASRTGSKRVDEDEDGNKNDQGRNRDRNGASANKRKRNAKDGLQIQVSAPVRFYLINYLRRCAQNGSSSIWQLVEPVLGTSTAPSDDEWIIANVDIKKYGLILLNSIAPDVGWEGGNSDVQLRVSGSIERPIVAGRVSVSEGQMSPVVLEEGVTSVRGEMVIEENGIMSLRSINGRCGGKPINVGGEMFLTNWHKDQVAKNLKKNEEIIEQLSNSGNGNGKTNKKENNKEQNPRRNRKRRRVLMGEVNEAKNLLQRADRGVNLNFGDIGVDFQKAMVTKMSGHLSLSGVVTEPCLGGSLMLSDGIIFLGNVGSVSSSTSPSAALTPSQSTSATSSPSVLPQTSPPTLPSDQSPLTVKRTPPPVEKSTGTNSSEVNFESGGAENQSTKNLKPEKNQKISNNGTLKFEGLKVTLGRNMKMVQSFVLNIQTAGELIVEGTKDEPDVEGNIRLVKGNVNLLASRMKIARGEQSYVKLLGKNSWTESGMTGEPEMIMQVVMEDDNLVVRIGECRTSAWMDSIQVRNKRRDMLFDSMTEWDENFRSRVCGDRENRRNNQMIMKRMVVNSFLKIGQISGKVGKLEWRVFPAVVSGGFMDADGNSEGDREFNLKEEFGGGGKIDIGGISISGAKSIGGATEAKIEIRLGRWFRLRIGGDRRLLSTEIDLFGRLRREERGDEGTALKKKDVESVLKPLNEDSK